MVAKRTNKNFRISTFVKNLTNNIMAIGDLPLVPGIAPGKEIDLLKFVLPDHIVNSKDLISLQRTGRIRIRYVTDDELKKTITNLTAKTSVNIITEDELDVAIAGVEAGGSTPITGTVTGFTTAISLKIGDYTLTGEDYTILVNAISFEIIISLPAATDHEGRIYNIKKIDVSTNKVIVSANGTETIDDGATAELTLQYECITIHSDGSEWFII